VDFETFNTQVPTHFAGTLKVWPSAAELQSTQRAQPVANSFTADLNYTAVAAGKTQFRRRVSHRICERDCNFEARRRWRAG
jgi:hypothetical protein